MNKLLHTPLTVHNVELANRLVMPPMATGKTPDGTVQDDLLAYYDARSKGGCIGLIVIEHAYVSPEGKAHEDQLSVSRDTDIPGLTKLVETIHKNNTRVIAPDQPRGQRGNGGNHRLSGNQCERHGTVRVCTQKRKARARNDRGRHAHRCKKVCRSRAARKRSRV